MTDRRSVEYLRADTETVSISEFADEGTGPINLVAERLICVAGPDLGLSAVVSDVLGVGREGRGLVLSSSDVSRRHAVLRREGGGIVVEDLGSSNGTFVNGAPIRGTVRLQLGDRVQFATTTFIFTRHDTLEDRLQQLQRLEAMAALVKGVAHDFNNMLTIIQAGLEELGEWKLEDPARVTLDDIQTATTSAAALVRRLQRIGRSKPPTFERVRLEGVVQESITMARRIAPKLEITSTVPPATIVSGSREELQNVFVNLLINARDAMPHGGRVDITASTIQLERAAALMHHLPQEGNYVAIEVRDTGTGMSEATLARIFEPFFTTKERGKGSGLGLAMVFSTLRNHGGAIEAKSTLGRGTTFELWLPAV